MVEQYDFAEQYKVGTEFEQILDKHFAKRYTVKKATQAHWQRAGIDRFFAEQIPPWKIKKWFSVEYKADILAHKTGNIFIEMEQRSAGSPDKVKPGWAPKIMAQSIVVLLPQKELVLWANGTTLKRWMDEWTIQYGASRWVENKNGWQARGVLVPIEVFRTNCCYASEKI